MGTIKESHLYTRSIIRVFRLREYYYTSSKVEV
jgi:hypothetical protein